VSRRLGGTFAPVVIDALDGARRAYELHDWQTAYDEARAIDGLEAIDEADRLDLVADTAWWLGLLDDCIAHRESAYVAYDGLAESRRAGQCAVWLYEHHCFKGQSTIGGAWLRRAHRSLDDDPECVEHGALVLREAEAAHGAGAVDRATAMALAALDLGRRLRSADLEAEALQTLGRIQIDAGEPAEGLAHLDEAMLFAVEGRLRPYSTGKVYCSLIAACEEVGDLARAAEWTEATARWADDGQPFAVFPGICRVHRALALDTRGALEDAAQEAERACGELLDIHIPNAAAAFAELGDIRRRLGDLAGAEAAYAQAEQLAARPSVGLAVLRLAQGRIGPARMIVDQCLEDAALPLARARLLPTVAQVAIAGGDLDAAAAAVTELEATAGEFGTVALAASARSARGRLELAQGDPVAARASLTDAIERWQQLDVPYEIATMRTLLGQAQRQAGDEESAATSFAAAEAMFERIGARLDTTNVQDLTGRRVRPAGLTEREVEVLGLVAAGFTNKDIAAELYLSEKTVSRHLSNIFTKIGVNSRAAATAYAFEHDLLRR
jgi:ATP/maltotriose-dependent transcriptional regulator MalT